MQLVEHHRRRAPKNMAGASATASSSASCSGVVSRMSGGSARWRWRLRGRRVAGPRLEPDRQPHLGDRRFEIARDVDRQRLERRDIERMQPAPPKTRLSPRGDPTPVPSPRGGGGRNRLGPALPPPSWGRVGEGAARRADFSRSLGKLDQARQEPRQRLARSGRRDQQDRPPLSCLGDQLHLVWPGRPSARGEPPGERLGQQVGIMRPGEVHEPTGSAVTSQAPVLTRSRSMRTHLPLEGGGRRALPAGRG